MAGESLVVRFSLFGIKGSEDQRIKGGKQCRIAAKAWLSDLPFFPFRIKAFTDQRKKAVPVGGQSLILSQNLHILYSPDPNPFSPLILCSSIPFIL